MAYNIPLQKIRELQIKNGTISEINRRVIGAIKSYIDAHPNETDWGSMTKRITGNLKESFERLLFDKHIVNWLCENRIDLSKIDGELRIELYKLIKKSLNSH